MSLLKRIKKQSATAKAVAASMIGQYDEQAVEKFAAGVEAALNEYHERHVKPLEERIAKLEASGA